MTIPRGIIFDMDGVLFDSGPFHAESWRMLAREIGLGELSDAWFHRNFGRTSPEILRDLLGTDPAREQLERLSDRKESLYREIAAPHVKALPGLMSLIGELHRRGWKIGIGSSGPRENVALIVERLGLDKFLAASISGHDVQKGKPDPEVFLKTAKALGVQPQRCVVVEDAPVGLQAARAAGMKSIGITTTHPPERLFLAVRVIHSFEELTADDVIRLLESDAPTPGSRKGHRTHSSG